MLLAHHGNHRTLVESQTHHLIGHLPWSTTVIRLICHTANLQSSQRGSRNTKGPYVIPTNNGRDKVSLTGEALDDSMPRLNS